MYDSRAIPRIVFGSALAVVAGGMLSTRICSAAPRDGATMNKVSQVVTAHATTAEPNRAEAQLLGTQRACADQCSPSVQARIWLYIGSIRGSTNGDQGKVAAAFEQALSLDPSWGPDPKYTNEPTLVTYQQTRKKLGIGVAQTQMAQLEPAPTTANTAQPTPSATRSEPAPLDPTAAPSQTQSAPTVAPGAAANPPKLGLFDSSRPMTLEYRPLAPIPDGYHLAERPRRGLMIGGGITTAAVYSFGLWVASANDFKYTTGWVLLPVLGPWLAIATNTCNASDTDCQDSKPDVNKAMAILGVGQAVGVGLVAAGLTFRKKVFVRNDLAANILVLPASFGHNAPGVSVQGNF